MIESKLPTEISYPNILPKGFPNIYKEWNLDPMTSNKQWANNDIVRFNFMNLGKGVFDPYKSYIEITVSCNQTDLPVGLLQIDNSAQSFIKQMVLYSKSREIERINEYGVLAAYLNDIGLNEMISEGRETEGLGYGSFDTMPFTRTSLGSVSCPRNYSQGDDITSTYSSSTIFPTIGNYWSETTGPLNQSSLFTASRQAKGHVTNANPLMTGNDLNMGLVETNFTCLQMALWSVGHANNIRAEYNSKYLENKFPEHTQSIPLYELQLQQQVANQKYPFYYSSSNPYLTQVRNYWQENLVFDSTANWNQHTINAANFGFQSLFSPFFTRGTFEPMISPTLPQCLMYCGQIQQTKTPIYRKKFKLPLISAVIGCLIDPSQFLLIPLESINNVMLEITLDPYAMFTSGYSDYCELDSVGIAVQQKRNYVIERIQYRLQTYHFIDEEIERYIKTSLVKEINIITNFWSMSNQYQIPGGTPPNNTYIVGCNATHLNELVALFVPNDYQIYSFARKHFRISNNVTQFWSKLGVDYWPPQPYKGNGGNVMSNNIDDDNSVYVENLYQSGNYMFSKSTLPRINAYNFSMNERPYNISNKNTFYDPAILNNQKYAFTPSSVNADTAMGMAWIHENRAVGKAAYIISFTPFSQADQILQGINVSQVNNFEIIFETSAKNVFPRDQTLYIFCKSSGVVKYSEDDIKTFGRG